MFHRLQNLSTIQLFDRSCDNCCICIHLTKHLNSLFSLSFLRHISTAQDNSSCCFYLIAVELTEVLQIQFAFIHVYNCRVAVQYDVYTVFYILYCFDHIRQLANSGWLDQNTIRMVCLNYFL